MWSQEVREAIELFIAFLESKAIEIIKVVGEFLSEYRYYILVGLLIIIILVILDYVMKWQAKSKKKRIDAKIEEQMKIKMIPDNSDEGP